ncbi:MAG: Na+/H+ antiporter NhaA [Actinobacteria bacterium]|nr:Na+/H+ antiporter NhaA [Actinomycetota bacterium]
MRDYLRAEAAGGLALLLGSAVALLWVNFVDAGGYASFWATQVKVGIGGASIDESLGHWVNDGLMTLFFFLISLEIKRELVTGELRHPKRAALPIIAALGGIVVPIAIFLAVTDGHHASGWGIPMATDAAFAIGVLALLGDRVSEGVKLLLLTIAVVDDVAAIAVIAVAYTDHLSLGWLGLAIAGLLGVAAMRALGVRRVLAYLPLGAFVWVATFESGVHATLAGVALALLTPATPVGGRDVLGELEHRLHPWVNLGILPLFALANAGVKLGGGELSDPAGQRIAVAVALGLVVGKFLGIGGATLAALRLGLGALPSGVDRRGLLGAAALGGIGFTVSLFITPLAYEDPLLIGAAKLGILGGSVIAATIGVAIVATRRRPSTPASAPDP